MFTGIHHLAIVVRDLERALRFFHGLIGLPLGARARVADQGVEAVLLLAGGTEIELLQPIDPAGGVARFLAKRGEGLHHLCIETPSVSAAVEQVPRPGLAGTIAFLHPRASQGILVEMAQPSPASPPATSHHASPVSSVPLAPRIEMIYAAAGDPESAAETFARNFGGVLGTPGREAGLDARIAPIGLGTSRLCVLAPAGPASPVAGWLADRGEGLFGLRLEVSDLDGTRRRLQAASIPVEAPASASASWRLRIEPAHAHGLHLLL